MISTLQMLGSIRTSTTPIRGYVQALEVVFVKMLAAGKTKSQIKKYISKMERKAEEILETCKKRRHGKNHPTGKLRAQSHRTLPGVVKMYKRRAVQKVVSSGSEDGVVSSCKTGGKKKEGTKISQEKKRNGCKRT